MKNASENLCKQTILLLHQPAWNEASESLVLRIIVTVLITFDMHLKF
jgi:hypothetical protein